MTKALAATTGRLVGLEGQRSKTVSELSLSVAIASLWPEAFEHGAVTAQAIGNGGYEPQDLVVRFSNEQETKEFPIAELPAILRKQHLDTVAATLNMMTGRLFRQWRQAHDY